MSGKVSAVYFTVSCSEQYTALYCTSHCSVLFIILQCAVQHTAVYCTPYCSVLYSTRGGVCQSNQTLMMASRDGCISLHRCTAAHLLNIALHTTLHCSAHYIELHTTLNRTLQYTIQYTSLYDFILPCIAPTSLHCTTLVPLHAELVLTYSKLLHFYSLRKYVLN